MLDIDSLCSDYRNGLSIRDLAQKYRIGLVRARRILDEAKILRDNKTAKALYHQKAKPHKATGYELPDIVEDDLPFEQVLREQLIPNTQRKIKHKDDKKWFKVRIKNDGPFLYVAQGDQHLDDPYCNLELFYAHVNMWRNRPDIFVLPMGDIHNNWVGRLEKLYAHQDMSRDRAYKAAEWYFREAGLQIPVALMGNHEVWNSGGDILSRIVPAETMLMDWQAQFSLAMPNGREVLIDAAHNHKGTSIYNALHGQKRAALFGRKAHAFISAHIHTPAFAKDWWPEDKTVAWYIRPGSYKWFDQHAVNYGFPNYQDAPAIAMLIDPDTPHNNPIIQVTDDMEFALDMLAHLKRKKAGPVAAPKGKGRGKR